jgi:hypothetical protein
MLPARHAWQLSDMHTKRRTHPRRPAMIMQQQKTNRGHPHQAAPESPCLQSSP